MVHSNWQFSRRAFAKGGLAAALAVAGGGGVQAGASPARARTRFNPHGAPGMGPGGTLLRPTSRPFPKVAAGTDMLPDIEHVVVLMMENHSFDDHLGMLGRGDGLTVGPHGAPVNYNPDPAGGFVRSWHLPSTCQPTNRHVTQSWDASHICWDKGRNDGFVKGCSPWAMGYWTGEDLPFYHGMAKLFPIADRYFCSVMAQTYPNRRFLIAGTALGDVSTDSTGLMLSGDFPNGTIFDRLWHYGISWKDYYPNLPTADIVIEVGQKAQKSGNLGSIPDFLADCAGGSLPSFSLVDPYLTFSEEDGDISVGEGYAAAIIDAVMKSPLWPRTALFWTYDEHGGYYDHVPPAPAVLPDLVPPDFAHDAPPTIPGTYGWTGFRVPFCAVSPFAKRNHVSHVVYDHTSVLKFLETKWNLPAMTYRDANAHNLLDMFDFSHAGFAEPPDLPAPKNPFHGSPVNSCAIGTVGEFASDVDAARWTSVPRGVDALLAAHEAAHRY
jgi:phospholipase C